MHKVKSYGWIDEKGDMHLYNRKRLKADIKSFQPCDIELTIKKRGKRSNKQNNYYWNTVVKEIHINFLERGERMTEEQVHEFLKLHFNPIYIKDEHGEVLAELPGSTTEFNKDEMTDYIFRIMEWASKKLGLVISEPNTQTQLNFDWWQLLLRQPDKP